jgi:hypothetical protein
MELNNIVTMNETTVVNVKVAHIRPTYNNLKCWMSNPSNVYIGRRGIVFVDKCRFPPNDSIWCNPYKIGKHGTREQVLDKYRQYMLNKLSNNNDLLQELIKLEGKKMGCWCYPEPCHGDILKTLIEQLK